MGNATAPIYTPKMLGGSIPDMVGGPIDLAATFYPGALVFFNPTTGVFEPTPAAGYATVGWLDSDYGTVQGSSVTGAFSPQTFLQKIRQGVAQFANGAGADAVLSTTPPGTILYAIDNQTVGLTDGGGTRPIAGRLWYLDSTAWPGYEAAGVWLEIRWTNFAPPAAVNAATVVSNEIVLRKTFTAVASGDITIFAAGALPDYLRILDTEVAISTAGGAGMTGTLHDQAAAAGTTLSTAIALNATGKAYDDSTTNPLSAAPGALVGLFLNVAGGSGAVTGTVVVRCRYESGS